MHIVRLLRNVGYSELRQHLAEKLDAVAKGDTILVERRGKVVAKIVPVEQPKKAKKSWHRKIEPIKIKGPPLSETIRQMRDESW